MNKAKRSHAYDLIAKYFFLACAVFGILAVTAIAAFVVVNAIPAFKEIGFFKFLFGDTWNLSEGKFGIGTMIVGSLYVTGGAVLIGVSIGLLAAIYISKFAPIKLKRILKNTINLLAGIPSVVYGFFGMKFIVPMLTDMSGQDGDGMLAASIVLGIMILPTIISISVNSLDSVPSAYLEGALALGASREQAVFKVMVPSAKSGILTSVVLGLGRALGETMAVIMVAGNSPAFPTSLFDSLRTLTGNVVLEMGYAERGSLHLSAIIGTGAALLVFVMLINIAISLFNTKANKKVKGMGVKAAFDKLVNKGKELEPPIAESEVNDQDRTSLLSGSGRGNDYDFRVLNDTKVSNGNADSVELGSGAMVVNYKSRNTNGIFLAGKIASLTATAAAVAAILLIVVFVFVNGVPHLTIDLLFGGEDVKISMLPALVSTLTLIVVSLAIALPIGISAAIYLNEYTKPNSKIVRIIRIATETLAGVPSIVFGLFGMLFFRYTLGMGYSLLAGALTLVLMILPTVIRTTEESLKCIPQSFREASLALGASKRRTIFKVVIPSAMAGIMNAIILSIGRIIGESAVLIFTAGSSMDMPTNIMQSGASLSVMLYVLSSEGLYIGQAYATAVVLILLVVIINAISSVIEKRFAKRLKGYV